MGGKNNNDQPSGTLIFHGVIYFNIRKSSNGVPLLVVDVSQQG